MKIYLIGMPGAGKSTLGRQLADTLSLPFFDLDEAIENHERKSIPEIFSSAGEDHFRLIEASMLRDFCARPESFVLATGGGAPCFFDNLQVLNNTGLTIYLDISVDVLIQRVGYSQGRPLLNEVSSREEKLRNLLSIREPFYKQARLIIAEPDLSKTLHAIYGAGFNR